MHPILRSKLATVILGLIAAWLAVLAIAAGIRRHDADAEMAALQARIEDATRENTRLADELERMKRPEWLALLARQRLNYRLPDETVVFVYKSEKAGTIPQPRASEEPPQRGWRTWLQWFRGPARE
jgi:cell division protein FtsB